MTVPLRVSVVIPLYNKATYVIESLRSVLEQGAAVREVIVVDDGSTDSGPALVAELASGEPAVRLISQKNSGVSAARNVGIKAAREEFVAFLDADDWYLPGYLETMLALAHRYENAAMFCSGYVAKYSDGSERLGLLNPVSFSTRGSLMSDFYRSWGKGSFTCTSAIVVRRNVLVQQNIWFPEGEKLGEDQDVWFRLAEQTAVAYSNQALVVYRMDVPGSATYDHTPLNTLPCYQRLQDRLIRGMVPPHLRRSARKLVASHVLNIANARLAAGDEMGAWSLLIDSRARPNWIYLARSLCNYACAKVSTRQRQ